MRPVDLPDARHMLRGCLHCGNRIEQGTAHSNQAKTNQPEPNEALGTVFQGRRGTS